MTDLKKKLRTGLLAAVLVLSMGAFVAACGSDDDDGGGGDNGSSTTTDTGDAQATAAASVEEAKQIPEFTLEAEPVDLEKVKGKTIFNIPVSSAIPYVAAVDDAMMELADELGINWVQFENQGTPTEWAQGINQAINQNADIINLDAGNDPSLVIPQLRKAQEAGIPVQVSHLYQEGEGPDSSYADLVTSYVSVPFNKSGELSVDYAVSEDGCDVNVLIINAAEVPPSDGIVGAMEGRLSELCPDAKSKVINVPVVDWGTKIQPEVQSALQADPETNWILPIYDSMSLPAEAGVRAAQKGSDVRIASYNGTPDVLKLIQDGDIMAADHGENGDWLAYANVDQMMRTLGGGPIIEDGVVETPLRTFDDTNVDDAGNPPDFSQGYGEAFRDGYEEIWGLN